MKEGKSDQAARCIKSRKMTKVTDYVISIYTSGKKIRSRNYVAITATKISRTDHCIHPSLSNNDIY